MKRHTNTFLRIISSCSILLTFVFYYNLIKSDEDARVRAEQQDTDRDLDRRSNVRTELTELYSIIPNCVKSVVELNPADKARYATVAYRTGELDTGLGEYRLKSIVFDLWVSDMNLFSHRKPNMVNRVAIILTQATSPILRNAWKEYSFQYSEPMNDFVDTMYVVIDEELNHDSIKTPKYMHMALKVLEKLGHLEVAWDHKPPYYVFKEVECLGITCDHTK